MFGAIVVDGLQIVVGDVAEVLAQGFGDADPGDAGLLADDRLNGLHMVRDQIGVLGMKSMGDQVILQSSTVKPIECLHYAMNLPTSVVITGIDKPEILDQAFEAVKTFKPMPKDEVAALLTRTKPAATEGKYEKFKTSAFFDSTAQHPEWLG